MFTNRRTRWVVVTALTGAIVLTLGACSGASPTATPNQSAAGAPGGTSAVGAVPNQNVQGGAGVMSADALRSIAAGVAMNGVVQQQTGIHVMGSGSVIAKPDIGVFAFGVEARAATVADARSRAAQAMDAVLKALRNRGVEDKDIQTQFFNIQPVIEYRDATRGGGGTPVITGYVVNNSATAKVRKLAEFGEIIDEAAKAGGNEIRVHQVAFSIDDPKPLEAKAREAAVKDGATKAQQMAQAAGVKLGAPVFISEYGGSPVVIGREAKFAPSAAGADVSTPISPGESQITISVQMVFPVQ